MGHLGPGDVQAEIAVQRRAGGNVGQRQPFAFQKRPVRQSRIQQLEIPGAFLDAGAYGAVMSSTYNARPLAAEVLVDGERYAVVRRRQSLDEMLAGEQPAGDWRRA